MSAPITETDTYAPGIQTPVLGDKFTYPETVKQALTDLASRTNFIQRTLQGLTGSTYVLDNTTTGVFPANSFVVPSSVRAGVITNFAYSVVSTLRFLRRSVWGATEGPAFMAVAIAPTVEGDGSGNYQPPGATLFTPKWYSNITADRMWWYQFDILSGGAAQLYWSVRGLPPAGKIIEFSLRVKGAAGHSGLPTTMPTLGLWRQSYNGTPTLIASVTDTSSNTTNYQAEHDLLVNGLNEQIASNTNYYFKLTGEAGTNKLAGFAAYECLVAITVP